jgi:cation diffusion facilitator family transporter
MEPDLSSSITMHPHPFNLRPESQPRSTSGSPAPRRAPRGTHASSTAVEASGEDQDPISRHPSTVGTDVESQVTRAPGTRLPRLGLEQDPYRLASAYKSPAELDKIKANTSRKREGDTACVPPFVGSARQTQKLQGFYRSQNAAIERLLKSVEEHRADARQEQGDDHLRFQIAVYGSFAANIVLAGLQVYAAISSGSLSLFTTMADAIFDPLSNLTLLLAHRAVGRVDPRRFPAGKARLETVGNIVFCFLMTSVSLILIAFSARELSERPRDDNLNHFHLASVISVCVAFATKLALFLYCFALRNKYSQIRILWQDHRNDLLVNGFGILTSVGGAQLVWWIDAMGAIILSVFIGGIWLRTAFAEFMLLVGVVASVETQQLITYVCLTHSPAIQGIDTVRVYHSGPRLIAEVDVVMDPGSSLMESHDVAEALQIKLESLPDVERAYVHIDYETTHKPEHAYKKDL